MTIKGTDILARESYEGLSDEEVRAALEAAKAVAYSDGYYSGASAAVNQLMKGPLLEEAIARSKEADTAFFELVEQAGKQVTHGEEG